MLMDQKDAAVPRSLAASTAVSQALHLSSILEPAKVVAWLGASATGLSILLGGIGFLALGAHDKMLGLPWRLQDSLEYVIEGAFFIGRTLLYVAAVLFGSRESWVLVVAVTGILAGSAFCLQQFPRTGPIIGKIAISGLLCAEVYALWRLGQPVLVTNLLMQAPFPEGSAPRVATAILENDRSWLGLEYGFLALLVLCLSVSLKRLDELFFAAESDPSSQWGWFRRSSFVLLTMCFVFLPWAYGVLTRPNSYPQVVQIITTLGNSPGQVPIKPPLFLLRENENHLLLYDPSSRTLITVKRDVVEQFRTTAPRPLFSRLEVIP